MTTNRQGETPEIANLNVDDLNVEQLEQRLELAVADLGGLWDSGTLDCVSFDFCSAYSGDCVLFNLCGVFNKPVE